MRRWMKAGSAVLLAGGASLAGLEVHRRSEVAGEVVPLVDPSPGGAVEKTAAADARFDPQTLMAHYQKPEEFEKLCRELTTRAIEIADRDQQYKHTDTILAVELDAKGKEVDGEETVDDVWYDKGLQVRQTTRRDSRFSNKKKPLDPSVRTMPKAEATFPFSREAKPDSYRYTLEGAEEIDGRLTLKIHYEPNKPLDGKMRGEVWVNPETFEPVRFEGIWAKLPPLVDQVSTRFDYGQANTGKTQVVRVIIAGSGGFAMFQKRFRVDSRIHSYRAKTDK